MAKIIAIVNQKGGVGKTTTSINLASFLAKDGKPTLLIDADPQANATSGIGATKDFLRGTIYDVLIRDIHPLSAISLTGLRGLHILPSTDDLAGVEVELVSKESREFVLKKAIEKASHNYSYILIDCPPSLGLLTVNALTAADKVIIPIQTEYFALEGLGKLLKTVSLIRSSLNPELEIGGALLTMHEKRRKLSSRVIEEVRKHFPGPVFDTVIPRNVKLAEAPSFGKSIFSYDIFSTGARAYKNLAKEVQERV